MKVCEKYSSFYSLNSDKNIVNMVYSTMILEEQKVSKSDILSFVMAKLKSVK